MVNTGNIHIVSTTQKFVITGKGFQDLLQQFFAVYIMSQNLTQRHRIGSITHKLFLVHIESYAKDASLDALRTYRSLYQRSTYLFVIPVYVVGPFQGNALGIGIKNIFQGYGSCHRQKKLTGYRHPHRTHQDTEEEVLSAFTLPCMCALTATSSLIVGYSYHHLLFI